MVRFGGASLGVVGGFIERGAWTSSQILNLLYNPNNALSS